MTEGFDLSTLDQIDAEIVERLGPWWQRVYRALVRLREEEANEW